MQDLRSHLIESLKLLHWKIILCNEFINFIFKKLSHSIVDWEQFVFGQILNFWNFLKLAFQFLDPPFNFSHFNNLLITLAFLKKFLLWILDFCGLSIKIQLMSGIIFWWSFITWIHVRKRYQIVRISGFWSLLCRGYIWWLINHNDSAQSHNLAKVIF